MIRASQRVLARDRARAPTEWVGDGSAGTRRVPASPSAAPLGAPQRGAPALRSLGLARPRWRSDTVPARPSTAAAGRAARHPLRRLLKRTPTIGCGVDVVELARFRRAVKRGGAAFMRRIFTKQEEAYARARRATTLLHLAGRFAAKEAVIKAVSQIDPKRALSMNQVEVRNDRLGRPHIVLHDGKAGRLHIHVSLSHVETVAVASAIAIK